MVWLSVGFCRLRVLSRLIVFDYTDKYTRMNEKPNSLRRRLRPLAEVMVGEFPSP